MSFEKDEDTLKMAKEKKIYKWLSLIRHKYKIYFQHVKIDNSMRSYTE